MSLTEREKEIALECIHKYTYSNHTMQGFYELTLEEFYLIFYLFLSRIREEQEAYILLVEEGTGKDIPLFITPPAAPCDCSELVEALKDAVTRMDRARGILTNEMPSANCNWGMLETDTLHKALANHAKRMKGGE